MAVEVQFTEMTEDGMLRHPVYLGERDDVTAKPVERPAAPDDPLTALVARLHELEDARKDGTLQLPGGHTKKIGEGFVERFYEVEPAYAVLIFTGQDCRHGAFPGVRQIAEDPRFSRRYSVVHNVQVMADASWCIFMRNDWPAPRE